MAKPHKPTVCFSFISPGEVRHEFVESLLNTMRHYSEKGRNLIRATVTIQSGPRIAEARSQVVDAFAATNCEWLWMVDADMCWEPDALDRLLAVADKVDAPIVGGLCFGGRAGNKMFPTIYKLDTDEHGYVVTSIVEDYPTDEVVRVGATGAAFLLVHRSVFSKMKQAYGTLPNGEVNPYPWFVEVSNGGRPYGEDIAFCLRANALGIPVHVDTAIKVGHIKTVELNEAGYVRPETT